MVSDSKVAPARYPIYLHNLQPNKPNTHQQAATRHASAGAQCPSLASAILPSSIIKTPPQSAMDNNNQPPVDPGQLSPELPYRHGPIRFLVLLLLALVVLANMYTFNNPQALQVSLMQHLHISETQFNLFYSLVALPNIVCPFFLGLAVDYLGVRLMLVALTLLVVVFQTLVAYGAYIGSYETMLAGRVLFGIAMESISVAQACFVSYWFVGKELAFAIGVATTLPELGNAINSLVTPLIYERTQSISAPLFVSVGLCSVSFLASCLAAHIDLRADQADRQKNIRVITDKQQSIQGDHAQGLQLDDFKQFKSTFWLLVCLCCFVNAQYVPFLDNVNKLLQVRFCFSQITAGKNIMVAYLATSLMGFPIGVMADRLGYKRYFSIVGMFTLLGAHFLIFVYPQCAQDSEPTHWCGASWGLVLLGLGYCFYANCIFSCVPLVVTKRVTGSAFGILLIFQNLAMAVCPMVSSSIVSRSASEQQGYRNASLFFTFVGLAGFTSSLLLCLIGEKDKRTLDGTCDSKKVYVIRCNPSQSDDEYIQQKRPSLLTEHSLTQRLMKTYSCVEMVSEGGGLGNQAPDASIE